MPNRGFIGTESTARAGGHHRSGGRGVDGLASSVAEHGVSTDASSTTATSLHIEVYDLVMARTNIDLDGELVERAMRMYRLDSKRAAVQLALEKLVGEPMTRAEVLAMQGTGFELANEEVEALSDIVADADR